ncbi:SPW repeat protein [Acaryochloris sp. CCMEE 5410]
MKQLLPHPPIFGIWLILSPWCLNFRSKHSART